MIGLVGQQMASTSIDTVGFFFDRLEFIIELIVTILLSSGVGVYIEQRWKISQHFKQNVKRKQSQSMEGSPFSSQTYIENYYGQGTSPNKPKKAPNIGDPNQLLEIVPPEVPETTSDLSYDQEYICNKISQILRKYNLHFYIDKYTNAISLLQNGAARSSASEYHSVFLETHGLLLEIQTYAGNKPTQEQIESFEDSFEALKKFISDSSVDLVELRNIIDKFENAVRGLLSYL